MCSDGAGGMFTRPTELFMPARVTMDASPVLILERASAVRAHHTEWACTLPRENKARNPLPVKTRRAKRTRTLFAAHVANNVGKAECERSGNQEQPIKAESEERTDPEEEPHNSRHDEPKPKDPNVECRALQIILRTRAPQQSSMSTMLLWPW